MVSHGTNPYFTEHLMKNLTQKELNSIARTLFLKKSLQEAERSLKWVDSSIRSGFKVEKSTALLIPTYFHPNHI